MQLRFSGTNELQLRFSSYKWVTTEFFLVTDGSQLSFLVASVVLSILQMGVIEIFKLQVGCNCNLLGVKRP
jgi:hypothetical protein